MLKILLRARLLFDNTSRLTQPGRHGAAGLG
jgi:hypothetical protein